VDTGEAKTIAELIECYQLPPQSILVEYNGLAVHRHEWPERPLAEGDRHRIHPRRCRRITKID